MTTDDPRYFGWKPDLPDQRDRVLKTLTVGRLPKKTNNRVNATPVLDQGALGSCTGNAWAGVYSFVEKKLNATEFAPSPLFIYFNERRKEGSIPYDAGASLRDGAKCLVKEGVCPEALWPYIPARFAETPPPIAYTEALKHQALEYRRLARTLSILKRCLSDGFPFTLGFTVYESFMSARGGVIPMPSMGEQLLGGHAVYALDYDDDMRAFLCRNSWSADWGVEGNFWLPYSYLMDVHLSSDFWTLRKVEV